MTVIDTVPRAAVRARRVLVVDDHQAFAELLCVALLAEGMEIVGTATSANQALAMVEELRPDVVVMDIQLRGQDGLAATRRIRETVPTAVVAIVTAHHDPDWVVRAAQAGASAFIPKDGPLAEMLETLANVRAGQLLVAPSTFAEDACSETAVSDAVAQIPHLTRRERQVLDRLAEGMHVKAIARTLGITPETCRGYIKGLHAKLSARAQLEAVVKAQQLGLLGPAATG